MRLLESSLLRNQAMPHLCEYGFFIFLFLILLTLVVGILCVVEIRRISFLWETDARPCTTSMKNRRMSTCDRPNGKLERNGKLKRMRHNFKQKFGRIGRNT